jgi:hypothetical protein
MTKFWMQAVASITVAVSEILCRAGGRSSKTVSIMWTMVERRRHKPCCAYSLAWSFAYPMYEEDGYRLLLFSTERAICAAAGLAVPHRGR